MAVRGKNGEEIPHVQALFEYEQFGISFKFNKELTADEHGVFKLGLLTQVKSLVCIVKHNTFNSLRTWKINDYSQSISYGGFISNNSYQLFRTEGQSFSIPLPSSLQPSDIICFKENTVLGTCYNFIDDLIITEAQLTIPNLTLGRYTLILLRY